MNSEAVQELISLRPELKSARSKLEAMEPGSYCIHRSWGFGQIRAYDEADRKLVIDFESKKGHRMDPAFCISTMEVLPPEHLLVRKQVEPEKIEKLVDEQPVQLIIEILATYPNKATTAIDLELSLARILGEARFKKWWANTKKLVAKDPRVASPAKKTECYVLREEPVSAEDELSEEFGNTRSARRKISLAEDLYNLSLRKEVKADIAGIVEGIATVVKDSNQLDPAQRLHGTWVRDDLAGVAGIDPSVFSPSQADLIRDVRELTDIAEKIPVQTQHRFLELVKEAHPLEWKENVFNLLKSSQGKFTTECINFLVENDFADELAATLKRWQTEQNLRAPVLMWIVKNRHSRKFSRLLHDLISPRLLSAIFFAIDYEALQAAGTRRIPLAEILSDDPDLISDLLATADPETARDLANNLILNQGFEELTKKSLLARFIKNFPSVQSLVASDVEGREETLLVSRESYERKRIEYENLVSKKIPENSRAIATAREHGDLRENAEFKMAKQDQQILMAQKGQLELELSRARITDFRESTIDQVGVGNIVELLDESTGNTVTYTILGAWDSDPENAVISYKTPLGLGLLSKRVNDRVSLTISGAKHDYVVKSIKLYIPPERAEETPQLEA